MQQEIGQNKYPSAERFRLEGRTKRDQFQSRIIGCVVCTISSNIRRLMSIDADVGTRTDFLSNLTK